MHRLIRGVHRFRNQEFGRYSSLFRRLSRQGQNPHTLFITCSDSRVLAELITQSKPGDLFVVKNLGNIVPRSDATGSTNSTAAAVEYAVQVLRVDDVVICGHSQCGAMDALIRGLPQPETAPHFCEWLALARPVRGALEQYYPPNMDHQSRVDAAAKENVLFALDNLLTFDCVQARLADGSLRLHGWFFEIATAALSAYDPESRQFHPLTGVSSNNASA